MEEIIKVVIIDKLKEEYHILTMRFHGMGMLL
jgi:hypothetical protein